MMRWKMYSEIHQLKELGFKRSKVARRLGLDPQTVTKYWTMTPDEFEQTQKNAFTRTKKLDVHEKQIVKWITEYQDITAAQIHDWIKEHYGDLSSERTVRNYVRYIRKKHNLYPNVQKGRDYEAVDDPPYGHQAQVDLGEITAKDQYGKQKKLYCFAMVLSRSRHKYCEWYDRSLTSSVLVSMHHRAFEYFGGMPKEIVYDQDKLVVVSENAGDIIYTKEFEQFRQRMKFKVWVCRAYDPETKGRIESVIKYVKRNFAKHRVFYSLEQYNADTLAWLDRTANAKIHGTTKKVPAEEFKIEKPYLLPYPIVEARKDTSDDSVIRQVRKDNTVWYKSSRYSVPHGTYEKDKKVALKVTENKLNIVDIDTGEIIAEHKISVMKGALVKNTNHRRDNTKSIEELQGQAFEQLGGDDKARKFLSAIYEEKRRYARDQYQMILRAIKSSDTDVIRQAMDFCFVNSLWSAIDFKSCVEYFEEHQGKENIKVSPVNHVDLDTRYRVKPQQREISEYTQIYAGGKANG